MSTNETSKSRNRWFILLILGAVIVGVILFYSSNVIYTEPTYNKVISALEQSRGHGIEEAAAYTYEEGPHKIVLLTKKDSWDSSNTRVTKYDLHSWNNLLDEDWRPTDLSEVELIAYLEERTSAIETVSYLGGPDITRYRHYLDVQLVTAKTESFVSSGTVEGPEPREANDVELTFTTSLYGGPVEFSALEEWLKEFVMPSLLSKQIVWKYHLDGHVQTSPAVADGKIYVGTYWNPSQPRNVYCLDASSGALLWDYYTDGTVFSAPFVYDGKVYFGSNNFLFCFDATSGAFLWNYRTGNTVHPYSAVSDGKIYMSSYDSIVYCLDASSGGLIWNYAADHNFTCAPAVSDGKIYAVSDNFLFCLDASSGTLLWDYQTGSNIDASPAADFSPAVGDNKVYVSTMRNLYCLDSSGALIWEYQTRDAFRSSPVISDDKIYLQADHFLYCFDADSGSLLWDYRDWYNQFGSFVVADGKIYLGSGNYDPINSNYRPDNFLYCLDASSGTLLWEYQTDGKAFPSSVVADGKIYLSCSDLSVYCVDISLLD